MSTDASAPVNTTMDPDTPSLSVRSSGSEVDSPDNDAGNPSSNVGSHDEDDEYEEIPQQVKPPRKRRKYAEVGDCYRGKISRIGYEFVRVDEVSKSVRAGLEDVLGDDVAAIAFNAIAKHFKCKLFFDAADDSAENGDFVRFMRVWKPTKKLITRAAIDILLNEGDRALKDGQAVMLHAAADGRMKISVRRVLEVLLQRKAVIDSADLTDAHRACPRKLKCVLSAALHDLLKFVRILVMGCYKEELDGAVVEPHMSADSLYSWAGSRGSGIAFEGRSRPLVNRALKEALERC
eukprot:936091-Prymnesium_polylepis.2